MTKYLVLGVALGAIVNLVSSVRPTFSSNDHLLSVLQTMHHSHAFNELPPKEKLFLTEMLAAAETDSITHYIDMAGFDRLLSFLDHVNSIDQDEAHLLERYLVQEFSEEQGSWQVITGKRDLQSFLHSITSNSAFQHLGQDDQELVLQLAKAAENGNATAIVHREGYARIIALVEHIVSPTETHQFLHYLVNHLESEKHHHHHNPSGPIVG